MRAGQLAQAGNRFTSMIEDMGDDVETLKDELASMREELDELRAALALKQDCPELL